MSQKESLTAPPTGTAYMNGGVSTWSVVHSHYRSCGKWNVSVAHYHLKLKKTKPGILETFRLFVWKPERYFSWSTCWTLSEDLSLRTKTQGPVWGIFLCKSRSIEKKKICITSQKCHWQVHFKMILVLAWFAFTAKWVQFSECLGAAETAVRTWVSPQSRWAHPLNYCRSITVKFVLQLICCVIWWTPRCQRSIHK